MHDENTQAVLLLTCYFSKAVKGEEKPLSPTEYGRFASWLHSNKYQPLSLFDDFDNIFSHWVDPKGKVTLERVKALLKRGLAMGLALEKWQSAGIWLMTRSDKEYPVRIKARLGQVSPPVLFGVGNKNLLNAGGVAVVGSRGITAEEEDYTRVIARQAALEGSNIVSGGAKGADEAAMLSALEAEGTVLGVLSDNLLKASVLGKWRQYLRQDNLALISSYYPEAGFNAGNAMGRNKYIYCLSDHALVVRSDKDKGGTWSGANENLKKKWVPLWVRDSDVEGNLALLQMGGKSLKVPTDRSEDWLLESLIRIADIPVMDNPKPVCDDLFSVLAEEPVTNSNQQALTHAHKPPLVEASGSRTKANESVNDTFFQLFTGQLKEHLKSKTNISLADLKVLMNDLNSKQITDWLDRAEEEKLVKRKGRTRTYQLFR